ncbi:MAG: ABC transporter permease [Acidobacteriaceae bacterium]|nr:ABC transporter permease [Acidobacteriaceae bacterium]
MSLLNKRRIAAAGLVAFHGVVLFAGFFAPYDPEAQHRMLTFAPPSRIRFVDAGNRLHLRPFVYGWKGTSGGPGDYQEDRTVRIPIRFFVNGAEYSLCGLFACRRHFFGADGPGRFFVMGTDGYGRDEFSRLLYGGRTSLFSGLFATAVSLSLGLLLGGMAGYFAGWVDEAVMRTAEIFMAMPWLYLLLTIRACLPLHINATTIFVLLITLLGLLGWARPARLIRGVVLSAKEREYVHAARAFGATDAYLLRVHILPQARSVAVTQAALLIPQYIVAEVMLSFFGLGIGEPASSWGNMLAALQEYSVLESDWWMFAPALALAAVLLAYQRLFSRYAFTS